MTSGRNRVARWAVRLIALTALLNLLPGDAEPSALRLHLQGGVAANRIWVPITSPDVAYAPGQRLDVYRPATSATGLPVVVMVHGCCGDRADLGLIPAAVAMGGAVVFNVDWEALKPGSAFRRSYAQVGCAVAYARSVAARFGGDRHRVTLLGWADGAMAATVVANGAWRWQVAGCRAAAGVSGEPDGVVGVAGFYGWTLPVPSEFVSSRAVRFLGGTPSAAPAAWRQATPYGWLGSGGPRCTLLLVGSSDPLAQDARRYAAAARAAGREVRLVVAAPAGDQTMLSPRTEEGLTTVRETLAAAAACRQRSAPGNANPVLRLGSPAPTPHYRGP